MFFSSSIVVAEVDIDIFPIAFPLNSINRLAFMMFYVAPVPDACECL